MKTIRFREPKTARGRRSERGSVVVVALLLILAMTGLGIIAFQTALSSLQTAASFTMSKQAGYLAELAMQASMDELSCTYQARLVQIYNEGTNDGVSQFLSEDPVCGLPVNYFVEDQRSLDVGTASFDVIFDQATLGRRAQGFDTSACYYRLRVQATGELEVTPRQNDRFLATPGNSFVRRRAVGYVYVGPVVDASLCGEG